MPTTDIHLKLDGIKGESTAVRHADEIDVDGWHWGVANVMPAGGGGGGGSAGKPVFQDLTFTHRVDRASPELWRACATGKHIKEALLSVARGGSTPLDYLTIKLKDVRVTAVQLADTAADAFAPLETVSLAFAKLQYDYRPQKPDGSLGPAVEFNFDLKTNKAS